MRPQWGSPVAVIAHFGRSPWYSILIPGSKSRIGRFNPCTYPSSIRNPGYPDPVPAVSNVSPYPVRISYLPVLPFNHGLEQ